MSKLYNLARVTTATTGTGTMTLSTAVSGFLTFANAGAVDGDVVSYAIRDGVNSEIGTGTYNSAGPTLTRTNILRSTNSNTAISLSGTAQVFITPNTVDFSSLAPLIAPSLTGPVLINSTTPQAQVVNTGLLTNNDARYRKLIKLVAAPGQFRMTDQPPAEYIDGDLMVARGNIVFPSPGARLRADMTTGSPLTNRFALQTSIVNGATSVSILPNGTSTYAELAVFSDVLATNGNYAAFTQNGTSTVITYGKLGTGTQGTLGFWSTAGEQMRLQASGGLSIGSTTDFGAGSIYMVGNLQISSGAPEIWFNQTTGATDGKLWRFINTASQLFFDIANDALTVQGCQWFTATRSANTITNLNWNVNTSGTHTWSVNSAEKWRIDASGNLVNTGLNNYIDFGAINTGTRIKLWSGGTTNDYGIGINTNELSYFVGTGAIHNFRIGGASGSSWLTISGTAVNVTTPVLQVNSQAGTPVFYMINTTSATDARIWRHYSSGNTLAWDVVNDAVTVGSGAWLMVTRSTTTVTNVNHNVNTSGTHTWGVNAVEKMRLDASGNLLIGSTSTAITGLDLVGGFCARGGNSGSYSTGTTDPTVSIFFDVAGSAGNIYSIASGVAWKALHILCDTFLVQAASAPVNAIFVDAAGNVAIGTTTTVSGFTNFVTSIQMSGSSLKMTAVNAGIEIGAPASSNTPFIDFHSSGGSARDYDARIIASGGSTSVDGQGSLLIDAKVFNVAADTATTAGGATGHLLQFGTTAGFGIYFGSGAPTISAAQGSIYIRSDGTASGAGATSGAGASNVFRSRVYINTNGSTGWVSLYSDG